MRNFVYLRPENLQQATRSLAKPGARVMGGGTDLLDLLASKPLRFEIFTNGLLWTDELIERVAAAPGASRVIVARGDVLELERLSLRLDNWRTALWVWSTSPAAAAASGSAASTATAGA